MTKRPGERDVRDEAPARGLLGLARRAGSVAHGIPAVREALRKGSARLLILAGDASRGQLAKLGDLGGNGRPPVRWMTTRASLGGALGRPAVSAAAVTKESFAEQLSALLEPHPPTHGGTAAEGRGPKEDLGSDAGG